MQQGSLLFSKNTSCLFFKDLFNFQTILAKNYKTTLKIASKMLQNLRVDDPSHNILGGVCIYFKQSLPLIRRDYLSTLQEI